MNEGNVVQKFIWLSERAILLLIAIATLYATATEIVRIIDVEVVNLSDLFLLFIYAEVLGMVASFYSNNRIPVTLPLIIAMTALTRMIILQSKDLNAINIIYEASGILILAIAAYIMTLKDKISLDKLLLREKVEDTETLEKKKSKPDKRKQPRTQAQIEATKRLVELRRKQREEKKKNSDVISCWGYTPKRYRYAQISTYVTKDTYLSPDQSTPHLPVL